MKRRTFLSALSGIMVGPALLRLARAEPSKPPARLLILFKPCGTVPEAYHPSMSGGRLWLSPILAPLESVREEMTVVGGLDNLKKPNTPGQDHGNGMVTFMTGGETTTDPAFLAVIAERMSIDQIFARDRAFSGDSVFKSIQLAADIRSDREEVFTRVLSYAGRAAPLPPEHRPDVAFAQLFGELLPGGASRENVDAAMRKRRRRESVLDFVAGSLTQLAREVPPTNARSSTRTSSRCASWSAASTAPPRASAPASPKRSATRSIAPTRHSPTLTTRSSAVPSSRSSAPPSRAISPASPLSSGPAATRTSASIEPSPASNR